MKKFLFGIAFILTGFTAMAQSVVTGKVVSQKTNDPLPFVNISIAGASAGTTSDVEGRFSFSFTGDSVSLVFSFVGYASFTTKVAKGAPRLVVKLSEKTTELTEVVVRPEDNPALKIIRRAIANKKFNDPENLSSFSYHAYNKLYMSLDGLGDTTTHKKETRRIRKEKAFSKFTDQNNLFVSESYTERKFVNPDHSKETVLGNKMSGIKDPFFAFMATDFQPFSFYRDYIPLLDIKYLNPISNGSTEKYDFTVTDTIYRYPDSVFLVSFEPLQGKSFQGLKGQLYISSDGYALEHVLAQTADEHALIDFHIQQKYAKENGHWFPIQLNSELRFKEYQLAGKKPRYVQRSYLSDIHIDEPIAKKEFGLLNVEFDPEANFKKDDFWIAHRSDSLDRKEISTYKFYDSLGPKINMLNANVKVLEGIIVGKFKVGKFYIPIDYLAHFNRYERVRVGMGFETGERISKLFTLDGYGAWGFQDRALKYGGGLKLNILRQHDGYFKVSYRQDIGEPGSSDFIKRPQGAINNETLRSWRAFRMDSIRQYKFEGGIRTMRFSQLEFFLQQQQRNPTYTYSFVTAHDPFGQQKQFTVTEAGVKWRMAFREHYTQIGNSKVVSNAAYPEINVNASHGFAGVWNGGYEFSKVEVMIDEQWVIRGLGTLTVQLDGGVINGKVPYPFLFNGKGSYYNGSFFNSFVINNYFQTMGFYEFASDRFAYFFLNHNFGRLTGTGSQIFRPELSLVHNMGIGSLANKADHQGINFSTMEKGYFESGLILNNVIRFKYLKLFYFGLGAGAFYRYGNYALPVMSDNFAYKFMLTVTF